MTDQEKNDDQAEQSPEEPQADAAPDDAAAPPESEGLAGSRLWKDQAGGDAPEAAEGEGFDDLVIEPEAEDVGEEGEAEPPAEPPAEVAAPPEPESEHRPQPLPVESLDACPNCGSPMREKDALVCLRCGYDIKQLKVIETKTGDEKKPKKRIGARAEAEAEDEPGETLLRKGLGGLKLPLAIAALGAIALIIGYLAGYHGLFPPTDQVGEEAEPLQTIAWSVRFTELGRFPILAGIWTLCGLGALVAASWMFGRPVGDSRIASARMLAVIVLVFCCQFIPIQDKVLSFAAEAASSLLAFFLLSMIFFRLKPRDAGTLMALAIVSFVALYLGAQLLMWAV